MHGEFTHIIISLFEASSTLYLIRILFGVLFFIGLESLAYYVSKVFLWFCPSRLINISLLGDLDGTERIITWRH